MEKLKSKVFYVLVLILSIFLISILVIFNYQSYSKERDEVKNSLTMMNNDKNGMEPVEMDRNRPKPSGETTSENSSEDKKDDSIDFNDSSNNPKKVFMDSIVYTVKLTGDGKVLEVVNHTENDIDEDSIKSIAEKILNSSNERETKIGNLYFVDYSYSFKNDGTIMTIVDNSTRRENLRNDLKISIVIFAVLEVIIIVVSKNLTKWIIKPAKEALNKQKRFITDASHELKTPIAVIQANSEALEIDFEKKWIDNIKSETERMNRLISNLLDLSKLENSQEKRLYSQNNLSKIVEKSALTFESLMFEKKIKLKLDIDDNIVFSCDSDQMKQLIGIMVDNAIKHSADEKGEIVVSLKNEKNDIVLKVSNKGNPIPKGDEEKIFERFYRVDESRNRNENRYGLGLAIAKSIVVNHGGKISARSADGVTVFVVHFKK